MKFFYSSGAVGFYEEGYFYHSFFIFPHLPFVTKTITDQPKIGYPYAVFPIIRSVYNKVSLHNKGIDWFIKNKQSFVDRYERSKEMTHWN